jgi:hypothetical protein
MAAAPPTAARRFRIRFALGRRAVLLGSALFIACEAVSLDNRGQDARACLAEPVGYMVAFLEEDAPPLSVRLRGTVVAFSSGPSPDAYRYVIRDAAGAERRLAYRAPGGPLPIKERVSYDFQVDYVGGAPAASGMLIRDGSGLVFAGATDQRLGAHVLKDGLPDLVLALLPGACRSRSSSTCYESITNQVLRASHSGRTVELRHGQSARLNGYQIRCLTAQAVTYRRGCADAGLPAVSYLVSRVE